MRDIANLTKKNELYHENFYIIKSYIHALGRWGWDESYPNNLANINCMNVVKEA